MCVFPDSLARDCVDHVDVICHVSDQDEQMASVAPRFRTRWCSDLSCVLGRLVAGRGWLSAFYSWQSRSQPTSN